MRHLAPFALVLGTAAASGSALAADKWNPDDTIREAIVAHVTQVGFDELGAAAAPLASTLIPADALAIPDIDVTVFALSNAKAGLSISSLNIVPAAKKPGAALEVRLGAMVNLGSRAEPYQISCLLDDGGGYIENLPITAKIPIAMQVVTVSGTPEIQVDINTNQLDVTIGNINANGACAFLLETAGNGLKDVLIDAVLKPQIGPLITDLEAQLSDALKAVNIKQELDVLGKTLFLELKPLQINSYANQGATKNGGLELIFSSKFSAAQDPCVADIDPLGSLKTDTPTPAITDTYPAQIGANIADDMINQALYAAFSGGILCIDVDESLLGGVDLPIPIDSSLLPLLAGDGFRAILPAEAQPLLIRTHPNEVPTARFDGEKPITLDVPRLGVDFITGLEHRQARLVGIDVSVELGIDLEFDGTNGTLAVSGLDVDAISDSLTIEAVGDEFVAGTNASLPGSIKGLLGTVLPLALGGLTDSLSFALPSFAIAEGAPALGLTDLVLRAGGSGDWLVAEAGLGEVAYVPDPSAGGCGGCGGCGGDTSGGGGSCGCSNGGFGFAPWFLVFLPTWIARRRKQG